MAMTESPGVVFITIGTLLHGGNDLVTHKELSPSQQQTTAMVEPEPGYVRWAVGSAPVGTL